MSEIQSISDKKSTRGVARSNKLSTRVDLTPMVDLGFLLITFFIFTTSMSQAKTMKLIMPDDDNVTDRTKAPAEMTLTLLLGDNHSIYYYHGFFNGNLSIANFNNNVARTAIQQRMTAVEKEFGDKKKTIILIKATDKAAYSDIVDAIDEMLINGVTKYMLLDADLDEIEAINKL